MMAQFDGIRLSDDLVIPEWELREKFVRIGGPGGQNVNKVASGVQLRWNVRASSLPAAVKARLTRGLRNRITKEGDVVIEASAHRRQLLNREAARKRLREIASSALVRPKARIATRPGKAAVNRRIKAKKQRGARKALRGKIDRDEL